MIFVSMPSKQIRYCTKYPQKTYRAHVSFEWDDDDVHFILKHHA
jgi:hypothetical protein